MNTTPEHQKRVALAIEPDAAHVVWVKLDQTGQPPRVVGGVIKPRLELISLDDSPIAIYRADTDESYTRDSLAALAELVRVVNGMPNVSVDVDEQMRQLREQLRATVENATETFNRYETRIARDERRIEKIIEQAREWKAYTRRREADLEQERVKSDALARNLRQTERELVEARDALQVARNAVERAVNRSNHSVEHVADARARQDAAKAAADGYRDEAESLRQQLGQATAETHDLRERIIEVQANALGTINRVAAALPEPVIAAEAVTPDVAVDTWFGEDNVPVVQIDTEGGHGRLRINLNDVPIYDGDPETDEPPGSYMEPVEIRNAEIRSVSFVEDGSGTGYVSVEAQMVDAERTIRESTAAVNEGTEKIEEATAIISRQLDTIRDQAERIEELQDALQRHVDSSHEVRTADFAAMREALGAEQGSDPIIAARRLVKEHEWAQVRIDSLKCDATRFMEERDEAARSLSRVSAERAEAWRNLDQIRAERDQTVAERDAAQADAEKLRRERDGARERAVMLDRDLTESEAMRKRLDEQLANERRVYETTAAALRAMLRERDEAIDKGARAIGALLPPSPAAVPKLAGDFRRAVNALPALEPEADARDGGLLDVIRKYDGLAQIGANLARGVRAWGSKLDRVNDHDARESVKIAALYEQEHEKLKL